MSKALIIVDPQVDFCEGGALAVPDSLSIFPVINRLRNDFSQVFITLDWHPQNHVSFAVNHHLEPFSSIETGSSTQMLWPTHCVCNSPGANIHPFLTVKEKDTFIQKGCKWDEESYSGFGTKENPTTLYGELLKRGVTTVYVVGIAEDYCVGLTALDAVSLGFETHIVQEGTRAVSHQSALAMRRLLESNGVHRASADELEK